MHLVQFLLPLKDNAGQPFDASMFARVRSELTDRFGGVTAFMQSPALGLWKAEGEVERDALVLFEVMVEELSRDWWGDYRAELEDRFEQAAVVMRAVGVETL